MSKVDPTNASTLNCKFESACEFDMQSTSAELSNKVVKTLTINLDHDSDNFK